MNIDFKNVPKHYASRTHKMMTDVLMDPKGVGPAIHYYMIRGGKNQKNITVWEPGVISGEYIKTYGHYHVGQLDETYWILLGEGVVIKQKMAVDKNGKYIPDVLEKFEAKPVTAGDKIYMPTGYGHLVANTGSTYLVTADDSPVDFEDKDPAGLPGHANYQIVKNMRGFAYYVVEHNGKPALVKNKLYKQIKKENLNGLKIVDQMSF